MAKSHPLESVDDVLAQAFPAADVLSWSQIGETVNMAMFSGACLRFLKIALKDGERLLCLKQTAKQGALLDANADEGKRLRAARTDFSFGNECTQLRLHSEKLNDSNARVPQVYLASSSKDNASFNLLMEAFLADAGWEQLASLPTKSDHLFATIQWLARFHAAFMGWTGRWEGGASDITDTWDVGSHTILERRPESELEKLPAMLASFFEQFASEDEWFKAQSIIEKQNLIADIPPSESPAIGPRLQYWAKRIAHRLRPITKEREGGAKSVTLIHADFKTGNLMFRKGTESGVEICTIDFQWTGPGVAATDVFYVLFMSCSNETCTNYSIDFLTPYHEMLCAELKKKGMGEYPYGQLLAEFKLAGLDFMRWLIPARLASYSVEKLQKEASRNPPDVNRGEWSRDLRRLLWPWKLMDAWLKEVETLLEQ